MNSIRFVLRAEDNIFRSAEPFWLCTKCRWRNAPYAPACDFCHRVKPLFAFKDLRVELRLNEHVLASRPTNPAELNLLSSPWAMVDYVLGMPDRFI